MELGPVELVVLVFFPANEPIPMSSQRWPRSYLRDR